MTSLPTPSAEQSAIISAARDLPHNLLVEALAGSGKTATLLNLLPGLDGTIALMAFNKSIADELQSRLQSHPALDFNTQVNTQVATVHAFGLRAYRRTDYAKGYKRPTGGKVTFILRDIFKQSPAIERTFEPHAHLIRNIVGAAKSSGFDLTSNHSTFPSSESDDDWADLICHYGWDIDLERASISLDAAIDLARRVLTASNAQRSVLDFNDMIYLPLLLNIPLPRFDNVLIDEAQDISATRRELAMRMARRADGSPSRIIAVGDRHQAIYGFTGADAASLDNIARITDAHHLPLTICWRCSAEVIAEAQRIVPAIKPRPDAPLGSVSRISVWNLLEDLSDEAVSEDDAPAAASTPAPGDAILCRLNRPNVTMALALLRAGIPARIEGRDIGERLLGHIRDAEPLYELRTRPELQIAIEDYADAQAHLLESRNRATQAALLRDECAAAIVLLQRSGETDPDLPPFAATQRLVETLFANDVPASQYVTLSSIHKAKGREWPRVFLLGRSDYMPFHKATADWELEQEQNLIYVAITRAELDLIYITEVREWLDSKQQS